MSDEAWWSTNAQNQHLELKEAFSSAAPARSAGAVSPSKPPSQDKSYPRTLATSSLAKLGKAPIRAGNLAFGLRWYHKRHILEDRRPCTAACPACCAWRAYELK
jgi:hypothetical protein